MKYSVRMTTYDANGAGTTKDAECTSRMQVSRVLREALRKKKAETVMVTVTKHREQPQG